MLDRQAMLVRNEKLATYAHVGNMLSTCRRHSWLSCAAGIIFTLTALLEGVSLAARFSLLSSPDDDKG